MKQNDFVYMQAYKGALAVDCSEMAAKDAALKALRQYKSNQFVTPAKMIKQCITDAKKNDIKKRKAKPKIF